MVIKRKHTHNFFLVLKKFSIGSVIFIACTKGCPILLSHPLYATALEKKMESWTEFHAMFHVTFIKATFELVEISV